MATSLQALLSLDCPTELRSIERGFDQLEPRNDVAEVCLTGLKWVRATAGGMGILGAVTWMECSSRVSRMADDLDAIGATSAGTAFRELRSNIPLSDSEISRGLVDWVDTEPMLRRQALQLDQEIAGISESLWTYMQKNRNSLPDIPVATSSLLVVRLRSLWSRS